MSALERQDPPAILVVDDDPQDRVLLSTALRREGYSAVSASGSKEARALLGEREFALVVCDVVMPGESGVSLARHVATVHPATALLVVSGSAHRSTAEAVAPVGSLLVKPFSMEQFLLEVAGTLVRHADRRARSGHTRNLEAVVEDRTHALEASERRARELLAELLQAEERERRRIAADLHDDTIQVMVAGLLRLDRLEARLLRDGVSTEGIDQIRAELTGAVERARTMLFELHPRNLEHHGLAVAVPDLVEMVAKEAGIACQVEAAVGRYAPALEQLAFRTIREALVNVRKHAAASRVGVVVRDDGLDLCGEVIDDGCGFDIESVRGRRGPLHFGLHTLAGRIEAAGGEVWVESAPGQGTSLRFAVPARRDGGPS